MDGPCSQAPTCPISLTAGFPCCPIFTSPPYFLEHSLPAKLGSDTLQVSLGYFCSPRTSEFLVFVVISWWDLTFAGSLVFSFSVWLPGLVYFFLPGCLSRNQNPQSPSSLYSACTLRGGGSVVLFCYITNCHKGRCEFRTIHIYSIAISHVLGVWHSLAEFSVQGLTWLISRCGLGCYVIQGWGSSSKLIQVRVEFSSLWWQDWSPIYWWLLTMGHTLLAT